MRAPLAACTLFAALAAPLSPAGSLSDTLADSLDLSAFSVQSIEVPPAPSGPVAVLVDLDGAPRVLRLVPHSMRADSFRLMVDRGGILEPAEAPPVRTYRGEVATLLSDVPIGRVRASLMGPSLHAFIALDDGTGYAIQPLAEVEPLAPPDLHVVYRQDDGVPGPWNCGTDALRPGFQAQPNGSGALAATGLEVCEVAVDADFEFFQANGSSVTNTVFDIENVLNGVESIYESDTGITYEVTFIVVRTSASSNPYTTSSSGGLLDQFRAEWNSSMGSVQRDVAHLFTGRNLSGSTIGVAWVGVICNLSWAYGLSQSKFSGNFAFRVGLTAHELGHNWNAGHCSGSDCRIMCPGIGGCTGDVTKFGQSSKNVITNYKNAVGCLDVLQDPVPIPFSDTFPSGSISSSLWSHVDGAQVNSNAVGEPSAPFSLNLDAAGSGDFLDDEVRSNFILAAGQSNLELSYSTEARGVEAGEELVVEYWNNNLTWVELNRITSDGSTQSAFTPHTHALPADAYHDELRIRFRAEVNAGNDDWYVDDVRVDFPAAAPPTLNAISPAAVPALGAGLVTLSGDHLSGATQVNVGGTALLPGSFTVVDDDTITFGPPKPSLLNTVNVTVTTAIGTSNPVQLSYQKTDPPLLLAPLFATNGSAVPLDWGGDPFDQAFLVVNFDGSTFSLGGTSFLNPVLFLPLPALDAAGLGGIEPVITGAAAGTVLHLQVWMLDPGATTTASLEGTNIRSLTVLF